MPTSPPDHPAPPANASGAEPRPDDSLKALAERCVASAGADQGSFRQLHDRLTPGLRAFFAKRLPGGGNNAAIDDLMQRVWSGLWEAFAKGRYDPERSAITTFAYAIAAKSWLRHLRSTKAMPWSDNGSPDDADALEFSDEPASEAAAAELLEAVRQFLRRAEVSGGTDAGLTADERSIILAAAAGASDRALAERFGLAASTINAKKQSGWEKVRRYLARLGHRGDSAERDAGSRE